MRGAPRAAARHPRQDCEARRSYDALAVRDIVAIHDKNQRRTSDREIALRQSSLIQAEIQA
jgi:hypothetical protein